MAFYPGWFFRFICSFALIGASSLYLLLLVVFLHICSSVGNSNWLRTLIVPL